MPGRDTVRLSSGTVQSLVLGTAQWGADYGVTNAAGRLTDAELRRLVDRAEALGITSVDTASGYGDAEERIGTFAPAFACQTKIAATGSSPAQIRAELEASLERLGRGQVDACLVHYWATLDDRGRARAVEALHDARADGLVRAVGISAGVSDDLESALEQFSGLDVVQAPVSILDQRLDRSVIIERLREHGVHIQARSIFLQGLALTDRPDLPFSDHPAVRALRESGRDRLDLCLGYVRSRDWIDSVVIAPTTAQELSAIHAAYQSASRDVDWSTFASTDALLLEPWRWPRPESQP